MSMITREISIEWGCVAFFNPLEILLGEDITKIMETHLYWKMYLPSKIVLRVRLRDPARPSFLMYVRTYLLLRVRTLEIDRINRHI